MSFVFITNLNKNMIEMLNYYKFPIKKYNEHKMFNMGRYYENIKDYSNMIMYYNMAVPKNVYM